MRTAAQIIDDCIVGFVRRVLILRGKAIPETEEEVELFGTEREGPPEPVPESLKHPPEIG